MKLSQVQLTCDIEAVTTASEFNCLMKHSNSSGFIQLEQGGPNFLIVDYDKSILPDSLEFLVSVHLCMVDGPVPDFSMLFQPGTPVLHGGE